MRVGTSLSRCVRDIFDGTVEFEDVLVIVARTDVDPENDNHWTVLWRGYGGNGIGSLYSRPEWSNYQEHEQAFRDICVRLKKAGKLHQPRQYGAHPTRLNEYWYDVILTSEVVDSNPAAKKAWENYKLIANLA